MVTQGGTQSFVEKLECTPGTVQHLECTTEECTTPWTYKVWMCNTTDIQRFEYTNNRLNALKAGF